MVDSIRSKFLSNSSKMTNNEFPEGKENYCPRCYFEDEKVVLKKDCPHNNPQKNLEIKVEDTIKLKEHLS